MERREHTGTTVKGVSCPLCGHTGVCYRKETDTRVCGLIRNCPGYRLGKRSPIWAYFLTRLIGVISLIFDKNRLISGKSNDSRNQKKFQSLNPLDIFH
jgi:hypothetical protein